MAIQLIGCCVSCAVPPVESCTANVHSVFLILYTFTFNVNVLIKFRLSITCAITNGVAVNCLLKVIIAIDTCPFLYVAIADPHCISSPLLYLI